MTKKELASSILTLIGGKENISSVVHCATRLRFKLSDQKKADKQAIEQLDGVISVIESGGQFQVVIGNSVAYVYKEFLEVADIQEEGSENVGSEKSGSIFSQLIDTVSAIFTPILGAMIGSGIIKGLLMMATMFWGMDASTGTYRVLAAASNAVFYFLPIILAYTAARKFKANVVIAMVIAGALIYPDMVSAFSNKESLSFLGIPIIMINYTSSVIPMILGTWFLSKVERVLEKFIPDIIKSFVIPLISLAVVVPVVYLAVGPLGNYLGLLVAKVYSAAYSFNPIVAGFILGGLYQGLVVFGLHWALGPIQINNVAVYGFDTITAMYLPAKYAQAGATLGIGLKTRNKQLKSEALTTAATTAIFGITEPAVYGFTLKYKKPFYIASFAGAIGGAISGAFRSAAGAYGISNTLTLPVFIGYGFMGIIIAITSAFAISTIVTYLFGYKDSDEKVNPSTVNTNLNLNPKVRDENLYAPVSGTAVSTAEIADPEFASEAIGRTAAIEPKSGKLYAPADGTVSALFPTKHALGILTDGGMEVLIHIGINTVELKGKYFKSYVEQDCHVKRGDLLLEFDVKAIKAAGYHTTVMVIVTNSAEYSEITVTNNNDMKPAQKLLSAKVG